MNAKDTRHDQLVCGLDFLFCQYFRATLNGSNESNVIYICQEIGGYRDKDVEIQQEFIVLSYRYILTHTLTYLTDFPYIGSIVVLTRLKLLVWSM